ncbi:RNA polymerase II elongation factor ELL3 [Aix galericulata]|nr:RNA polymerase II elongation factor ELL3 [Aix galericulata]
MARAWPAYTRSQPSSSSLAEIPDYLRKYHTIRSAEQCRSYEAAFNAEYAEYRYLHARIGGVSQKFIQLGARMKTLKQGTEEHQASSRPGPWSYPNYQQEKNRCEYLHQKLSHIKRLVLPGTGEKLEELGPPKCIRLRHRSVGCLPLQVADEVTHFSATLQEAQDRQASQDTTTQHSQYGVLAYEWKLPLKCSPATITGQHHDYAAR